MPDILIKSVVAVAESLLKQYHFDTGEQTCDQVLDHWLRNYDPRWVRLALIEALYQGRYKAISVEQILVLWLRRGQPSYRFSHEFEALICNNLPQDLRLPPQRLGKSSSRPRPVTAVAADDLTSPPSPTLVSASLPSSVPPTSQQPESQLSEPLPIANQLTEQPTEHELFVAPPQELASNSTEPVLPLVTEPTFATLAPFEPDQQSASAKNQAGPETSSNGRSIPNSAAEITKFQPAPANSEVYKKLREIARTWHRSESEAAVFIPSEEQQTPLV